MGRSGRPTPEVVLSGEERQTLERWARRPKSAQALALRCRIVLAVADGEFNKDIADRLGCHPTTVGKWRSRSPRRASAACTTSLAPVRPAPSAMTTSRQ